MPAKVFGSRWQVIQSLGEGGQAHTFKVIDQTGNRDDEFVLKRLKNVGNPARVERFRQEVETLQSVMHPNIVRLIAYDLDASPPYLVAEYCAGGDLEHADVWRSDRMTALRLFIDICEGVRTVHDNNVIHRDLKPSNILLRGVTGPAVVADFGLCYVEGGERHTMTEEAVGARYYMAPEMEDGRADQINRLTDVYSLGKVLYFLFSGGAVFSREQHREPQYDLVKRTNDASMEHVNRLLDRMIVIEQKQRLDSVDRIIQETRSIARLWLGEFNVVSAHLPQRCTYCGIGIYQLNDNEDYWIKSTMKSLVQSPWSHVMICNVCGHVQVFLLNSAESYYWWSRDWPTPRS